MTPRLTLFAPLALIACQDAPPTWTHDVEPIVKGRCSSCHADGAIGGFPLGTYDEVVAMADAVADATAARTMPPWPAVPGHMDYANDRSLTDDQIQIIQDWVAAGLPEGDPEDAGDPLPAVGQSLPEVDVSLSVPEPYTPSNAGSDDYRCFPLAWTATEDSWVTGFEVHPENGTAVHHAAAYLFRPDSLGGDLTETLAEWDAADEGPGYSCWGGPSRTGDEIQVPVQQLGQWVPGSQAMVLPADTGILVPAGSTVVLQMHYNLAGWDNQPDQTSIDFDTAPSVAHDGAFAPWLDPAWPMGDMTISAGQTATYDAQGDPISFWDIFVGDEVDVSEGFNIHSVMLHMHQIGASGVVRLDAAGGTKTTLLEVDDWDFLWQLNYELAEPVRFSPGDEMYVSCTYDNTTGADVSWGEGSGDEMCVGNLYISEL